MDDKDASEDKYQDDNGDATDDANEVEDWTAGSDEGSTSRAERDNGDERWTT
jgi:hypothetical protein